MTTPIDVVVTDPENRSGDAMGQAIEMEVDKFDLYLQSLGGNESIEPLSRYERWFLHRYVRWKLENPPSELENPPSE